MNSGRFLRATGAATKVLFGLACALPTTVHGQGVYRYYAEFPIAGVTVHTSVDRLDAGATVLAQVVWNVKPGEHISWESIRFTEPGVMQNTKFPNIGFRANSINTFFHEDLGTIDLNPVEPNVWGSRVMIGNSLWSVGL